MSNTIAEGIFTKEQQDYVNSIDEKDLRSHLLHQVRLRDNLQSDRDYLEKRAIESPYMKIAELISTIFFYGKFKVETPAEAELEKSLIEVGLWPTTEDEIINRNKINS